jgi:hypothetical protein
MPGMRRVVVLNSDRVVGQLEHFRVVDAGAFPSRLRNPDIDDAALAIYQTTVNTLRRTLESLGLQRRPRTVVPNLREYLDIHNSGEEAQP